MALFKVYRGNESNLPIEMNDGWAYFCTDSGNFYIDWLNGSELTRTQINANYASNLKYLDGDEYAEIDATTLMQELASMSDRINVLEDSCVQSDWNENDKSAADYIKNRTHYEVPENVIFDEDITVTGGDSEGRWFEYTFPSELPFKVGKTYSLTYTVSSTSSTAIFIIQDNLCAGLAIDNFSSGNFSFGQGMIEPAMIFMDWPTETSGRLTIKELGSVKQLDPKYIKDMYYTEIVSETREFTEDPVIDDLEFAKLLYKHRKDAIYTVSGSDEKWVYGYDDTEVPGYAWMVVPESGGNEGPWVFLPSSTEPPDITLTGQIGFEPNASITINYEVVHKIPSKYIGTDWNVNDPETPGYIANRTHYDWTEVLFEAESVWSNSSNAYYFDPSIELIEGETYYVEIDGVTYSREAVSSDQVTSGYVLQFDEFSGLICGGGIYMTVNHVPVKIYRNILKQLDQKYIPNANWNQNDENGDGYIKNRPFYDDVIYGEWVENSVNAQSSYTNNNGEIYYAVHVRLSDMKWLTGAHNGDKIQVKWDGVVYNCTVFRDDYGSSEWYIGNKGIVDTPATDTGEPFYISYDAWYTNTGVICSTTDMSNTTFSCRTYTGEIKQLDPKYIPDSVKNAQPDWDQEDETSPDFIKNKPEIATDDEIIEMLMQEDMIPIVVDADGSILSDENSNILLW